MCMWVAGTPNSCSAPMAGVKAATALDRRVGLEPAAHDGGGSPCRHDVSGANVATRQRKDRAAKSAAGTQGRDQAASSPSVGISVGNSAGHEADLDGAMTQEEMDILSATRPGTLPWKRATAAAGGRPTKYNAVVVEAIVSALKAGATYEHAAAAGGISYQTFNEWRKDLPEFSEAIKAAEGDAARLLLGKIQAAASEGAWQAAAWILERRWPEQYGRNLHQHKHEGTVKIRIERVNDWRALGKAEIETTSSGDGE